MPLKLIDPTRFNRRAFLAAWGGAVLVTSTVTPAFASPNVMRQAQIDLFGDREIKPGRVNLKLPSIAENGFSVALDVEVESPMTDADHVKQIAIFSPRNPIALLAHYQLGPRAGKAAVSTRIRLSGSQTVQAVAEMNDGTLWSGSAETFVTLAACVIL